MVAHNAPAVGIHDQCQIAPGVAQAQVGDVGHPDLLGSAGAEHAVGIAGLLEAQGGGLEDALSGHKPALGAQQVKAAVTSDAEIRPPGADYSQ